MLLILKKDCFCVIYTVIICLHDLWAFSWTFDGKQNIYQLFTFAYFPKTYFGAKPMVFSRQKVKKVSTSLHEIKRVNGEGLTLN